jgi:hypothetical protein
MPPRALLDRLRELHEGGGDLKILDVAICRHTLEDIANPVFLCRELSRVSRAGYVETPRGR